MNKSLIFILIASLLSLGLILGLLRSGDEDSPRPPAPAQEAVRGSSPARAPLMPQPVVYQPIVEPAPTALPPEGAIPNEVTLLFPDNQSLAEARTRLLRAGYTLIAESSSLHALRVRTAGRDDLRRLTELAGDQANIGYNFPVSLPTLPGESYQGPAGRPFGASAIRWMGAGDDPTLGRGITIAVIDSGVAPHPNIRHALTGEIDLVGSPQSYGHGTAVASLIAGLSPDAPGIAPSAEILSVRVLDGEGATDAFTLAQAIVTAADAGAQIINLSLGAYGDAHVLREAVRYAENKGSILVASTGNDGVNLLAYPAAYPGVIAVGAVDAAGQRAGFSNFADGITITAPGVGIHTAWDNDGLVSFSGTSASAPLVSGALAALLSENPGMSGAEAVAIMVATANDSGPPGLNPHTGHGSADLRRMLNHNTPGIHDVAVADHYIRQDSSSREAVSVLVTVQNRGTTWAEGTLLTVAYEGREQHFMIEGLNPGQTTAREILLNPAPLIHGPGTRITSRVSLSGAEDANPGDNLRSSTVLINHSP